MARLLGPLGIIKEILRLIPVTAKQHCVDCRRYDSPLAKAAIRASLATFFNGRVQGYLFFLSDKIWLLRIDGCIMYKQVGRMNDKTAGEYLLALCENWIRFSGPMGIFISGQTGALTNDLVGDTLDRYNVRRELGGANPVNGNTLIRVLPKLTVA